MPAAAPSRPTSATLRRKMPGRRPPRPPTQAATGRWTLRRQPPAITPGREMSRPCRRGAPKPSGPSSRMGGASKPAGWAGQRRQGRPTPGALSGQLTREPVLIVPNRSDVERVERDLLARAAGAARRGDRTFDDVFERIAYGGGEARPVLAERSAPPRPAHVGGASLNGLGRSARFAGFADALRHGGRRARGGPARPGDLAGDLARLYAAYRAELDRLGPRRPRPAEARASPARSPTSTRGTASRSSPTVSRT